VRSSYPHYNTPIWVLLDVPRLVNPIHSQWMVPRGWFHMPNLSLSSTVRWALRLSATEHSFDERHYVEDARAFQFAVGAFVKAK
jgi:hypothetical protein